MDVDVCLAAAHLFQQVIEVADTARTSCRVRPDNYVSIRRYTFGEDAGGGHGRAVIQEGDDRSSDACGAAVDVGEEHVVDVGDDQLEVELVAVRTELKLRQAGSVAIHQW